ncbi:MAG: aminoacyl-tRNA hydrolase [Candidatus Omnitrophica bacterium]|nr:aminoacyl-tRNA hydrolase [Candidatus Omnitrophota bacterium]
MKIICGLGNPGAQYAHNRHNAGFIVLDRLAKDRKSIFKRRFLLRAHTARLLFDEGEVFLVKPSTFMNNSGIALKRACAQYHASCEDVLVVYDDTSLALGAMRFRESGSSGGHKGMASVIEFLGSQRINRLRIGIDGAQGTDLAEYVLSDFLSDEKRELSVVIEKAATACIDWVVHGSKYVMNKYNNVKTPDV